MRYSFKIIHQLLDDKSAFNDDSLLTVIIEGLESASREIPVDAVHRCVELLKDTKSLLSETERDTQKISSVLKEVLSYFYPIPAGQKFIIERMEAVGYTGKLEDGVCFGVSCMAMQAFLAQDFETFKQRLIRLNEIPVEDFENDLRKLREEEARGVRETITDILAFFDGVVIHQNPKNYPEIVTRERLCRQDERKTLPIIAPDAYQPAAVHTPFVGTYTKRELTDFLYILGTQLAKDSDSSFSLQLGAPTYFGLHAINLNYDASTQCWHLVDPNRLPDKRYALGETECLAQDLMGIFPSVTSFGEGCVVLKTSIYTRQEVAERLINNYIHIRSSDKWCELHEIAPDKLEKCQTGPFNQIYYLRWLYNTEWGLDVIKHARIESLLNLFLQLSEDFKALVILHRARDLTPSMVRYVYLRGNRNDIKHMLSLGHKPETSLLIAIYKNNDFELARLVFEQSVGQEEKTDKMFDLFASPEMKALKQQVHKDLRKDNDNNEDKTFRP